MNIITPFALTEEQKIHYLTEDWFTPRFSVKQQLYYKFLRPFIPIPVRQKIQKKVADSIIYKENFIDDELVNHIIALPEFEKRAARLYPEGQNSVILLTHDVEEEAGLNYIPEVIKLEERYGFKSSWNIVPYKYPVHQRIIDCINDAGHEIGIHGYNHDGNLYKTEQIFRERSVFINEALAKYGAVGFRSPMVHRNLKWLQLLDISYDASCFDYDPFQPFPGGVKSIWAYQVGKFVEFPYTLPQDHTMFYSLNVKDIDIWINKIEWLVKNKGMIVVLTHPDYLMTPEQLAKYEKLLQYLNSLQGAGRMLPRDYARFWRAAIGV